MKISGSVEKWASGVLGVICLLLVLNLVRGGVGTGSEKTSAAPHAAPAEGRIVLPATNPRDELSRYNPQIELDRLSDLQSSEIPKIDRNPFEFPAPKEPPKPQGPMKETATPVTPPPPSLPIKMIGYSEKPGGLKEGIVVDDDGIYVVHEGETFNKRYKVNKLTTSSASIYDEVTKQTVELPIAQ